MKCDSICICNSKHFPTDNDDNMDTAIIKVCQDEADNTGGFAKISDSYFDLITTPTGWLLCYIIQQAQVLLQLQNMAIHGFQRTTLGPVKNCDSHCLCISSAGYLAGHVNLSDSLYDC
ncbi:hypothetical protein P5673_024521, partial [Acropora cervicornis]